MFIAGKMFESPDEAKKWVEANVSPEERPQWVVIEFEGWMEEAEPNSKTVEGSVIPSKDKS